LRNELVVAAFAPYKTAARLMLAACFNHVANRDRLVLRLCRGARVPPPGSFAPETAPCRGRHAGGAAPRRAERLGSSRIDRPRLARTAVGPPHRLLDDRIALYGADAACGANPGRARPQRRRPGCRRTHASLAGRAAGARLPRRVSDRADRSRLLSPLR